MATKLDKLLIIDVEATCWRGPPPPGEVNEIIEVGLCIFDLTLWEPLERFSIPVRPILSSCSIYCTELTGWTDEMLKNAHSFSDACNVLTTVYNSKRRVWASWGDYDRLQFERDCNRKGVTYPFGTTHFNLKPMFSMYKKLKKGLGLKAALNYCGLTMEGTHHQGSWDAWNVGRILQHGRL